ncbi:lysine-specific demethylase 8 [Vespula pensylvanica]|nr:lysine-specific demethylase 8 [Vespula pensylvanica]
MPISESTIEHTKMAFEAYITTELIDWILLKEDLKYLPTEIEVHVAPMIDVLQRVSMQKLERTTNWINKSLIRIEACLDRTWQLLNSGHWKDVPLSYRYSYSFCSLLKVILLEIEHEQNKEKSTDTEIQVLQEIIQQIDKGILLGAPLPNKPSLLTSIASKINNHYTKFVRSLNAKKIEIDYSKVSQLLLPEFLQINRYRIPSMESFYKDIFIPKVPAIITDSMKHWNALHLWQDINYLNKIAGSRTVPIEIGSRYTEEDWSQDLITFSEFLQSHIIKNTPKVGYLAQHQLFDQIPELKNDIVVPDYCSFSDKEDSEVEPPDINAWFGPAGTVSPLHFDIKNNLLCQVFGYKRIFLYDSSDSINLYPYDTKLLYNTAQVDPLKPDYIKWPDFKKAKGFMCYLGPGEMLYIPPNWWHHVTALTPSFSVSFWWT